MPKAETNPTRPLSEPTPIQDIFCSELVKVEKIGPCVRLTFAVDQTLYCGTHTEVERAVVAKLVVPADCAQAIIAGLAAPQDLRKDAPRGPRLVN